MSHLSHRKETNCLNCGTTVIGKYCHNCGQENIEPKESLWHLILHFFNDLTHFDGKFFSSLKDLLFKPGYLSKEYIKGRRASYLNPIRMYLFTSFTFFLVFFSLYRLPEKEFEINTFNGKSMEQIDSLSDSNFKKFSGDVYGAPMTRKKFHDYVDSIQLNGELNLFTIEKNKNHYANKKQYDSLIKVGAVKDGWLRRHLIYREFEINKKYSNQKGIFFSDLINSIMHHFPQMLFISLPLVALLLQLLYIRQKNFYYVAHAIFTIHLYIFVFIVMLIEIGISQLTHVHGLAWLNYINNLLTIAILFYLYKAMRNFYEQQRFKTILKYILFLLSFFILIILLFMIFALVSAFQI
jgi:hypothetical protein